MAVADGTRPPSLDHDLDGLGGDPPLFRFSGGDAALDKEPIDRAIAGGVAAAAPHLEPVAVALQSLAAGLPDCGLLVDERFAALPGAATLLDSAHVAQVRGIALGSTACAASLLPAAAPLASGGVQYLTRIVVPAGRHAEPLPLLSRASEQARTMATHVVYRGRAIPIDRKSVV